MTTAAPEVIRLDFPIALSTETNADGTPRREVTGIAVTFEEFDRPDWRFETSRMVIDADGVELRDKTFLAYGHDLMYGGVPIGRVTSSEVVDGVGVRITARLAKTAKADEVYALMQPDEDGVAVLDRFSIGFYSLGQQVDADNEDLLHHTRIDVFEVSVVPIPQLDGAAVESVLHQKEAPMPAPAAPAPAAPAVDVEALSQSVDLLTRRIETFAHAAPADERREAPGGSYGALIQLAATGDADALDFLEYVGGVTGDLGDYVKDAWVGDLLRLVEAPRTTINTFRRAPLPVTGMGVEYGKTKLDSDTTTVTEQEAEGADLPSGKIELDTASSPIKTYGGAGSLTIQQIKRMPISVVETLFRALVRKYAATTEAAARSLALSTGASTALTGVTLTADDIDSWIDFLVDCSIALTDEGLTPEFVYLTQDVFKVLAKLRDGANGDAARVLGRDSGSVSVKGLSGEMYNLRLVPVKGAGGVRVGAAEAITTWEDGGAPFRLQEENILNLTGDFAVYGFAAFGSTAPEALLRPATYQATDA